MLRRIASAGSEEGTPAVGLKVQESCHCPGSFQWDSLIALALCTKHSNTLLNPHACPAVALHLFSDRKWLLIAMSQILRLIYLLARVPEDHSA